MMDVRAVQKKIKIRHSVRHDQKHHGARGDECENESE